jgi:hypothetical protein
MALLRDPDGLDRVRLGDLRPEWLHHDAARTMVDFAQRFYDEANDVLKPGPNYFGRLWQEVGRILVEGPSGRRRDGRNQSWSWARTNSSTLICADRRSARNVPLATTAWSGTESVAIWPGRVRMTWLPL